MKYGAKMNKFNINNKVTLIGIISKNFKYSHAYENKKFYRSEIHVQRLSGKSDDIPFVVSDQIIDVFGNWVSELMCIKGEYRSRNDNGKLNLYVYVLDILPVVDVDYKNEIYLSGYLCKPTYCRSTPLKREITDIFLAVNRSNGRRDYIPCIAWGESAKFADSLNVGTHINIEGRIQKREYYKQISDGYVERKHAYEVSISQMEVVESEECKNQIADAE